MMRKSKLIYGLLLLAGLAMNNVAMADGWHGGGRHFGGEHWGGRGFYGSGFGWGLGMGIGTELYMSSPFVSSYYGPRFFYPYPYAYNPQVVVVPAQPQVYVEKSQTPDVQVTPQQQVAAAPQASNYWYHCKNPEGYYPYVQACPSGWSQVAPTPPSP